MRRFSNVIITICHSRNNKPSEELFGNIQIKMYNTKPNFRKQLQRIKVVSEFEMCLHGP